MANTWGVIQLQIVVGSAKIGDSSPSLSETPLLPDPNALSAISTVLQQQGRKRRKINARLCVPTMADYITYLDDKDAGAVRALIIEVTATNGNYIIESVGEPEFKPYDQIYFDVTWMEG